MKDKMAKYCTTTTIMRMQRELRSFNPNERERAKEGERESAQKDRTTAEIQ